MRKPKVLMDFSKSKYTDKELVIKARFICEKMTGNANFPNPIPTVDTMKAATDDFEIALEKTEDGTHEDTVIKNQKRDILEGVMRNMAIYVQTISQGNEAMTLNSGNDSSKAIPTPSSPLDAPTGLIVTMGINKGSVILSCNPVKNAKMYLFEYRIINDSGDSVWIQILSTKHKIQIDHLISLQQYAFRVAAAGTDPSRNYCNPITSYIL